MGWPIPPLFLKFAELLFPKPHKAFTDLPDELIVEVLVLLEVNHILNMRQVCRRFEACTHEKALWRRVVLRMARDCALAVLPSISRMSAKELEQLAIRRIRAKQRAEEGLSRRIELRSLQTPIRVSTCHLVPGGQWLITFTWDHEVYCWDLGNWATKEPILLSRSDDVKDTTGRPFTAVDYPNANECILAVARLRAGQFKIEIHSLDFTQPIPRISVLGTIAPSQGNGSVLISGPYITRSQDVEPPVIECFNWEQCFFRKRFDYTAITFRLPPSRSIRPTRFLSNGLLFCETELSIIAFKLDDFQPVSQLGETDPIPSVPYWWYSPTEFQARIPTWPTPATLSPPDVHLQPLSFVRSTFLVNSAGYVLRVYTQNGEPVVHRIPFDHPGDFAAVGWGSGFRVLQGSILSFRVSTDSVTLTDPVPLDMGTFRSRFFSLCNFDEFSGHISFVRCGKKSSRLALVDLVD